jgi:hypothetical protein
MECPFLKRDVSSDTGNNPRKSRQEIIIMIDTLKTQIIAAGGFQ